MKLTEEENEAILKERSYRPVREFCGCLECGLVRADLLHLIRCGYLEGYALGYKEGQEAGLTRMVFLWFSDETDLEILWKDYACEKDENLTTDGRKVKQALLKFVAKREKRD